MNKKGLYGTRLKKIRRRYAEGESSYKLAEEYHYSQSGLYAYLKDIKRPIKRGKHGISDRQIQQIRTAYKMGIKTGEIAEAAGLHRVTVQKYTKDLRKGA